MKLDLLKVLYGCAALAFAAGLGLTALTAREAGAQLRAAQKRAAVRAELQAVRRDADRYHAAVGLFEALSNSAPASLAGLAAAAVTNAAPDLRELESRALDRGWTLRRVEVIFNELQLDQLPAFLGSAEAQRPPWRLAECAVTASSRADGYGRAVLILEAIGKPEK